MKRKGSVWGFPLLCEALLGTGRRKTTHLFLLEAHSQILQQALKDLDKGLQKSFFAKRADFPRFKRKGGHDAFRYPQGFRLDEDNSRIFLPKIGYVRYRNSRRIEGTPKQVTVSPVRWQMVCFYSDGTGSSRTCTHFAKRRWHRYGSCAVLQRSPMVPASNHCTVSENMKRSWQSCSAGWQNE